MFEINDTFYFYFSIFFNTVNKTGFGGKTIPDLFHKLESLKGLFLGKYFMNVESYGMDLKVKNN